MSDLSTQLPPLPSFLKLRLYLLFSSILAITAFTLPVKLSLVFKGSIIANGPTTALESTTEGTVASVPAENQLIERNAVLFDFDQPVLIADLKVLRVKE